MFDAIDLILAAVIAAGLGLALGRYLWPSPKPADIAALAVARKEAELLQNRVDALEHQQRNLNEGLKSEFENIATRVLKANALELTDTSQKQIDAILKPLREQIHSFQGKVESTYDAEKREVLSLKAEIERIAKTSQSLGTRAEDLANALKGDVKTLGRWGEVVLERILESAGLTEGRDYILQGQGLGLRNEAGGLQRPDVILCLPSQRTMIIDSKVSLDSYEQFVGAGDEAERGERAGRFVRDMKRHIDALANKHYQDNAELQAHEYVLMFVCIEGALAAALTADPNLFNYAWERRVVLVGPPTLLMTARTVASIWRYELQARNSEEIARLSGVLCDKIADSLNDLQQIGEFLERAASFHQEAVKRLSSGKGNALSIGQRIRKLGVKSRKALPAGDVEDDEIPAQNGAEEG